MSLFGSQTSTLGAAAGAAPNNDYTVPNAPPDGISSLSWSPQNNVFVASSWDNGVRAWEVQRPSASTFTAIPRAQMNHAAPVLCTAFHHEGTAVFSGGVDNVVKRWNLATGQTVDDIGKHDAPIRTVHWLPNYNLVASGSWDKSVRFWDVRAPSAAPAASIPVGERVYASDVRDQFLVVATADRKMRIFDLRANCALVSLAESTLKYQTRCVAAFPDGTGYAVGSIEGRVSIEYFAEQPTEAGVARVAPGVNKRGFAFKCHRDTATQTKSGNGIGVFSINAIAFHPYGTFATVGSDGCYNFWDKDSRQRLKQFNKLHTTISTAQFSADGNIFAYAASYDWSQGVQGANPSTANSILLRAVTDEDIKPREKPRK